jgi:hypothetical protein
LKATLPKKSQIYTSAKCVLAGSHDSIRDTLVWASADIQTWSQWVSNALAVWKEDHAKMMHTFLPSADGRIPHSGKAVSGFVEQKKSWHKPLPHVRHRKQ